MDSIIAGKKEKTKDDIVQNQSLIIPATEKISAIERSEVSNTNAVGATTTPKEESWISWKTIFIGLFLCWFIFGNKKMKK